MIEEASEFLKITKLTNCFSLPMLNNIETQQVFDLRCIKKIILISFEINVPIEKQH